MPDKTLHVIPIQAQHPEIGRWLWALAEVRKRTLALVDDCDQRTLDWTGPDGCENSIGSLLYHIAAVEMYWVFLDILGRNLSEDVKALLPLPGFDENQRITRLTGVSRSEHVDRLHSTRKVANAIFAEMDVKEWRRARAPLDGSEEYEVTPEWAVFHLIEHESGHAAQISSLKARSRRRFASTIADEQ
jgi:hypothetical protein